MPLICPNGCEVEILHTMDFCPNCTRAIEVVEVLCEYKTLEPKCEYRDANGVCIPKSLFDLFECIPYDEKARKKREEEKRKRREEEEGRRNE